METGKKWYVVKAISGKEKKVQERIRYEISRNHLEDYVSQVLIPTEKVVQAKNGKKVTKEREGEEPNRYEVIKPKEDE